MKTVTIQVKAFQQILDDFIRKKKINPPDAKGLRQWCEKEELENDEVLGEKYLSNWFSNLKKKEPSDSVGLYEEKIIGVVKELGYVDLRDFLDQNGYVDDSGELLPVKNLETLRQSNPPHTNEWLDKYIISARLVPGLISLLPLILLFVIRIFEQNEISNFLLTVFGFLFLSILYLLSNLIAALGRNFERKYFEMRGLKILPTAYLMSCLHESCFTERQKSEYRKKVLSYFQLCLLSNEQEKKNKIEALQLLAEAGEKVKNTVKKDTIRSANIQYGLFRNLVPSTLIGLVFSMSCVIYSIGNSSPTVLTIFIMLSVMLLISHLILRFGNQVRNMGETFATYLLNEFLSR